MLAVDEKRRAFHQADAILHPIQGHREVALLAGLTRAPEVQDEALHEGGIGQPLKEPIPLLLEVRSVLLDVPLLEPLREFGAAFGVRVDGAGKNHAIHPLRERRRQFDRNHGAGVMPHERRPIDLQRVEHIDHGLGVLGDRGLPFDRVRAAVAGIVDGNRPAALREQRHHLPELIDRPGRLVEKDQRRAFARTFLDTMDATHRGVAEEAA